MGQQFGTSKMGDIYVLTYIRYSFPPFLRSFSVIVSNEHFNGGTLFSRQQLAHGCISNIFLSIQKSFFCSIGMIRFLTAPCVVCGVFLK